MSRPTSRVPLWSLAVVLIATAALLGAAFLTPAISAGGPGAVAAKRKGKKKQKPTITGKLSRPGYTVIALAASGKATTLRAPRGKLGLRPPANTVTLHLRAPDGTYAGPIVVGGSPGKGRKGAKKSAKKKGKKGKERVIVGVTAGAKLGKIKINAGKGYAKVKGKLPKNSIDARRWARAKKGVPIGNGNNVGRVRSERAGRGGPGDADLDGVPNVLDIDDDGDLILDNLDRSATRARVAQTPPPGGFPLQTGMNVGLWEAANANAPGLSGAQIEAALPKWGVLGIGILPGDSAELDCGQPQSRTDPGLGGLVYCTAGGTGQLILNRPTAPTFSPFPACCDPDGDRFGTLVSDPTSAFPWMWLAHGATSAQIGTGDVLIQRVTTGGTETEFVAAVQYVFVTTPALVSYSDGQGNSATVSYPVLFAPPSFGPGTEQNPFPVKAGPDGDVVLTLTFWRPQRRPIPPETGTWIDIGGLNYAAAPHPTDAPSARGYAACPKSAYSSADPNLVPTDPTDGATPGAGGFRDLAGDRPASPDNTFTYQLNLTDCLAAYGASFSPGERRSLGFSGFSPQPGTGDVTGVGTFFRHVN